MKSLLQRLQPREVALVYGVLCVALTVAVFFRYLVPSWDSYQQLDAQVQIKRTELARALADRALKPRVDAEYETLGPEVLQTESEQITTSLFLKTIESTLGRNPSLVMVNARPLAVKPEHLLNIYRVRITVAGQLPDLLHFVNDITHAGPIIGIETYSLRGVQGGMTVEATLGLQMVRLTDQVPQPAPGTSMHLAADSQTIGGDREY